MQSVHVWPALPPCFLTPPPAVPPQAALGVNSALFSFAFVVFNFLAVATTPLVAAALAAGDEKKVCERFTIVAVCAVAGPSMRILRTPSL